MHVSYIIVLVAITIIIYYVATSMSVCKYNIENCNIKVFRYEGAIGWSAETMQDFRP